jgi:hypothetical protein
MASIGLDKSAVRLAKKHVDQACFKFLVFIIQSVTAKSVSLLAYIDRENLLPIVKLAIECELKEGLRHRRSVVCEVLESC